MRSYRLTVILLIILAVSIGVYALIGAAKPSESSKLIYSYEKDSIVEISITAGESKTTFVNNSGQWEMTEPEKYKINKELVDILARKLENLEALRVIEKDSKELGRYGLDKPGLCVNFKLKDGKKKSLLIGVETASKFQNYVKDGDGSTIYTVTQTDLDCFKNGRTAEFRDRNFLSVDRTKLSSFGLDINKKRELKLVEYEAGKWEFAEPCRVNAKNDAVKDILKGIVQLKIKDFIEDNPTDLARYSLDNPLYTLQLGDKNGKTQTMHFGKADEDMKAVYMMLDDMKGVFTISTEGFVPESIKIGDLLSEAPLSIGIGKVSSITVNNRGIVSKFIRDTAKEDDIFTLAGKQLNMENFTALYVNLMALTSDGYDAGNKGESPDLSVTYELLDNSRITMELTKRNESSYYLTVDGKPMPFYVGSQKVELVRRWLKRTMEN